MPLLPKIMPGEWGQVDRNFSKITKFHIGPDAIPTYAGLIIADGGTVGQAAGPLLKFNDTGNQLGITGCDVGIGTDTPDASQSINLHIYGGSAGTVDAYYGSMLTLEDDSFVYINLLVPTDSTAGIRFGEGTDNSEAHILADFNANTLTLGIEAGDIVLNPQGSIILSQSVTLNKKITAGSFATPTDVTNTRQYGAELHYSGNNYDVTGIRSRAHLVTTDASTRTALGGLFQAANNDNIDAGVLMGFMAEAIGKSTANASTITTMRGGLIGTEWGALDTVTNLKTLHIRGHSRNAAGAGSFGTGYALYVENEAVGGNGQAYDAGIYFKGTNLSAGNKAFTYGIDFTGSTYGTAEMLIGNAKIASSTNDLVIQPVSNSTTFFQLKQQDGTVFFNGDSTNARIGIGTATPAAILELYATSPYLFTHNSGADNANDSRRSEWMAKGHKANDALHALGFLRFGHDGTGDDQKGMFNIYLNDGNDNLIPQANVLKLTKDKLHFMGNSNNIFEVERTTDSECSILYRNSGGWWAAGLAANDNFFFYNGHAGIGGTPITLNGTTNFIGFHEASPETPLELTHTTPYMTLHNSTHEDGDGGRESRLNFKGEQSGEEETTLARIEAGHDGAADDEKGYWDLYTNDGSDSDSPTKRIRINSAGAVILTADAYLELTQKAGTAVDGDLWNDSTQKALQTFVSGIEQTLVGVIFTQTADQTIANTTTETTLFGTGVGTLTLPANFWTVGKTIRIEIHGDFADTGNPTAEVQAYYGTTSLIDSGAIALSGLGGTEEWETEVVITCRSVGVTGTVETIIDWEYETTTGSSPIERLDVAGVLQTINTTASGVLDVTFQWGTAAAANSLHSHVGFVEVLN